MTLTSSYTFFSPIFFFISTILLRQADFARSTIYQKRSKNCMCVCVCMYDIVEEIPHRNLPIYTFITARMSRYQQRRAATGSRNLLRNVDEKNSLCTECAHVAFATSYKYIFSGLTRYLIFSRYIKCTYIYIQVTGIKFSTTRFPIYRNFIELYNKILCAADEDFFFFFFSVIKNYAIC